MASTSDTLISIGLNFTLLDPDIVTLKNWRSWDRSGHGTKVALGPLATSSHRTSRPYIHHSNFYFLLHLFLKSEGGGGCTGQLAVRISGNLSHLVGDGSSGVHILRGGRVERPRLVGFGGFHRVRFRRKSPKSTKRFSQNELVIRYYNKLINQYE